MSEKKLESIMRESVEALNKRDFEKALSFFAEDAVWVAPEGTFKGKAEIKRYLTWGRKEHPDQRLRDVGITVKGNKGVYEHIMEGTIDNMKYETMVMCIWEFSGEKIQQLKSLYDRLSIAKQVAKGIISKRAVTSMLNQFEKGLH